MGDPGSGGYDDRHGADGVPRFRPLTEEGSLDDLERGMVAMSLNEPRLSDEHPWESEGPLTIRGWAHARGGIDAVYVVVDGRPYEALRPVVRTDLLEYYGADAAREAGFVLRLHPDECPPGMHRLAVVAVAHEGDAVGVEGEIACRPDPLDSDAPPGALATVDWMEPGEAPQQNVGSAERSPSDTQPSPEELQRLHGLALMWESRALLAEADAAASRIEAGLASTQQQVALETLRKTEARLRETEARLREAETRLRAAQRSR